jgi:polyisoprenoid-binding protein YceI
MKYYLLAVLATLSLGAMAADWQYQFDSEQGKVYFDFTSIHNKGSAVILRVKNVYKEPRDDLAAPEATPVKVVSDTTRVEFDCKNKTMWLRQQKISTADGHEYAPMIQPARPWPLTNDDMVKEHRLACQHQAKP